MSLALICGILLSLCSVATADLTPITSPNHIFINVANESGVKYNYDGAKYTGPNNSYYIKFDGGGLNALHVTNDPNVPFGQVNTVNTTSTSNSAVFYVWDTGGRPYNDDAILLVSVKGPLSDDFSVNIKSSGYSWTTPDATGAGPTSFSYVADAVNETFTKDDFIYGPNVYKPGTQSLSLPLYYGQDTSDPSTAEYLMFVDLYAGTLKGLNAGSGSSPYAGLGLTDNGAIKVEYSFTGLTSTASFNDYVWCLAAAQGEGISWTNRDLGDITQASGYTVNYVGAPVPIPAAAWLLGSGLAGLGFLRRRFTA
jgi:hypothetical protein